MAKGDEMPLVHRSYDNQWTWPFDSLGVVSIIAKDKSKPTIVAMRDRSFFSVQRLNPASLYKEYCQLTAPNEITQP
jgi:hypothetical protein